jgi:Derlin-2/3
MFLSNALNYVMTYYWGRKSKNMFVNFMGIFIMRAPYLPFFYLGLSFLLDSDLKADILGITIGHLIFYLKDIYPRLKRANGKRPLQTPGFILSLSEKLGLNNEFIGVVEDENEVMF